MEENVKLLRYNKFVIKMGERNAVRVLDIYGLFLQEAGTINLDLFERFIGAPKKKVDMVHWNKKDIKLVDDHLKRHL
uniref:Uncharacterized protein n=1 Tax=Timema poppense TaxID=170557 RepID=A0A7R9CWY2_TIMPO|nr:unnamed protein product [Timema poppensis]